MIDVLIGIGSFVAIAALIWEGASRITYGKYLNGTEVALAILKNKEYLRLNSLDSGIISIDGGEYISKHYAILCKWHVSGWGQVPRWSKASRLLDNIHKEMKANRRGVKPVFPVQ